MKRLLILFAAIAFAVACKPDPQPEPQPQPQPEAKLEFKIVSENPMEFSADGGDCVIRYAIENPDENLTVSASSDADWILESDATYAGQNEIFFIVEKNEGDARSGKIVVTYDKEYEVIVNQEAAVVEPEPKPEAVELPYLSALYFGNQYGATENDYNYSLILSTAENVMDVVTGEITLSANSTYLLLDLFADVPSEAYNVSFTVPAGEYVFDMDNTLTAGTLSQDYTYLLVTDEEEGQEIYFVSGKLVVTDEKIEAQFVAEDGTEYSFYTPQVYVDNSDRFVGDGYEGEFSTLSGDRVIPFEDSGIYAECNGDYYVVGKNDWYLYVDDYTTGETLLLEVLAPLDEEIPVGEFVVSSDLSLERMALPGFVSSYGEAVWSWYAQYGEDGYEVIGQAPIVDGKITITDNGDETYSVVCDLVDDCGNKITGECTTYYETVGFYPAQTAVKSHTMGRRLASKPVRSLRK